jgi:hypothetical protein
MYKFWLQIWLEPCPSRHLIRGVLSRGWRTVQDYFTVRYWRYWYWFACALIFDIVDCCFGFRNPASRFQGDRSHKTSCPGLFNSRTSPSSKFERYPLAYPPLATSHNSLTFNLSIIHAWGSRTRSHCLGTFIYLHSRGCCSQPRSIRMCWLVWMVSFHVCTQPLSYRGAAATDMLSTLCRHESCTVNLNLKFKQLTCECAPVRGSPVTQS